MSNTADPVIGIFSPMFAVLSNITPETSFNFILLVTGCFCPQYPPDASIVFIVSANLQPEGSVALPKYAWVPTLAPDPSSI